jgi:protein-L-isoaspartate O-methyltransferase
MNAVDRANYVKDGVDAYHDSPQLRFHTSGYEMEPCFYFINRTIGHGATISAPHMVSFWCPTETHKP